MVSSIAYLHPCHSFNKPLNPILGETYQATLADGSSINVEQISHHPPISFMCLDGPNGIYRLSGYANFAVKAWVNSVNLNVQGNKTISFPDGTEITHTLLDDTFGNTLIGTLYHQLHGKTRFYDKKNNITGYLDVGFVKGKPRDYFSGYIEQDGIVVCDKIFGNYMGYADFDGERFFDLRNQETYEMIDVPKDCTETKCLFSDSRNRIDLVSLL